MMGLVLRVLVAVVGAPAAYVIYVCFIAPRFNPLMVLPSPPLRGLFDHHMGPLLDPSRSPRSHEIIVKEYGRSVRVRGMGPWDERFFTLDPLSLAHILKNSTIYEKPWQSRRLITSLIGCGMLAAEGVVHKRQRRVATPAFSIGNMRALVPLVFGKGCKLRDRWLELTKMAHASEDTQGQNVAAGVKLDAAMWISRATFDVIGLAGFGYDFNSIQDETNELFMAYKDMFETAISQDQGIRSLVNLYTSIPDMLFPTATTKLVARCQKVIQRVAGDLIQEKKARVVENEKGGAGLGDKDLLSLLLKSNVATDLPPDQRISDEDILHNINTFMFAGSDTTSLALTWTLYILTQYPALQTRLRAEILDILPPSPSPDSFPSFGNLTEDEIESLHTAISELPFLHNVCREVLRLIPPVHSSLRVATQDDVVPTSYPVMRCGRDGILKDSGARSVKVPKGTFVHVPIEAFNLDKGIWGEDAWEFNPDRWDNVPELAQSLPGLFSNMLTFSAGPRSCIGMRFSMIEMKTFLAILLSSFTFSGTDDKIFKANVVLTRPYISGKFKDGSQCPLIATPYLRGSCA